MSSDHRDVYIIRGTDGDDKGEWVTPEPAEKVIVEEILEGSDLSRDDVEPLSDHVDFEQLHALLAGGADEQDVVSVSVGEWDATVFADGSVTVEHRE